MACSFGMNPMIVGNMGNFSNISMKAINIDNNCLGSDFLERERYLKFLYKLRFGLQCDVMLHVLHLLGGQVKWLH